MPLRTELTGKSLCTSVLSVFVFLFFPFSLFFSSRLDSLHQYARLVVIELGVYPKTCIFCQWNNLEYSLRRKTALLCNHGKRKLTDQGRVIFTGIICLIHSIGCHCLFVLLFSREQVL